MEEEKEPVPAPIQAMNMTMSNLRKGFLEQHDEAEIAEIADANIERIAANEDDK